MKIFFDGQIFIEQPTGGISRYFANLATSLNRESGVTARVLAPFHRNEHLSDQISAPVLGFGLPKEWRAGRICWAALRTLSPVMSRLARPDIAHETYFSPKPYVTTARRRVTTVYDMIHELYYPGSLTSQYKRIALARCDHVICISHNTKKNLCELFDFPPERASVTHLAYQDFSGFDDCDVPTQLANIPYFLYVGSRSGYKNFETLLRAFANAPTLVKNFRIVCFGGASLSADERALAEGLGLAPRHLVQLSGGDALLGAAYANATAFVCPSLLEGFGIPPLEAMSAGCPVLSSNTSSLPEVVGDAALLFDPKDQEALREALERIVQSDSLSNSLVRRGHEQRKLFSWERCARETLNVYRYIL